LARSSPGADWTIELGCVNEDQPGDRYYDHPESDVWAGNARIGSVSGIQSHYNAGREPLMLVWEDDNGSKCEFNPEAAEEDGVPFQSIAVWTIISAVPAAIAGLNPFNLALVFNAIGAFGYYFGITSGDDFIGVVAMMNGSEAQRQIVKRRAHTGSHTVLGTMLFETQP
jgi:hypothetical protein